MSGTTVRREGRSLWPAKGLVKRLLARPLFRKRAAVKRICVVGSFSGRNAGDAAILGGLLQEVSALYPQAEFLVPTIKPEFIRRQYSQYRVRPVGLLPWNASIKIFGLPILTSIFRSDLVLVTDAILFDKKLLNPLFNYLSTLALVLPLARRMGKAVVLYNVNLGPIRTRLGRKCLNRVLKSANKTILRDKESAKELPGDFPRENVLEGADSALNIVPASADRVDAILAREDIATDGAPFMTLTVSKYIGMFLEGPERHMSKEAFLDAVSGAMNVLLKRVPVLLVLVVTQVMDAPVNAELLSRIEDKHRVRVISTHDYDYAELAGVFGRAELHVGARTHSLILASSRLTPVVGIIVTPKNRGYMETIAQEDFMVPLTGLETQLLDRTLNAWQERAAIRLELAGIMPTQIQKARSSAGHLGQYLGS